MRAGSRAALGKTAISGTPNCLKRRVILWYAQFTNMAAALMSQTGGPRVADPCFKPFKLCPFSS